MVLMVLQNSLTIIYQVKKRLSKVFNKLKNSNQKLKCKPVTGLTNLAIKLGLMMIICVSLQKVL